MDTLIREKPAVRMWPLRHRAFLRTAYPGAHPGDDCPACHSNAVCWIANDTGAYNYLCEVCGRCWTLGPSGAVRVNPVSCPPCEHREVCLEGLRRDVRSSYWLPTSTR